MDVQFTGSLTFEGGKKDNKNRKREWGMVKYEVKEMVK